jgi:hypothetical protein
MTINLHRLIGEVADNANSLGTASEQLVFVVNQAG